MHRLPFIAILLAGASLGALVGEAQINPFDLVTSVTVDGGDGLDDEARGVAVDAEGRVFVTGYVTIAGHGRDIWLARYDSNLVLQDGVTLDGPASGDDEGYTMAFDGDGFL